MYGLPFKAVWALDFEFISEPGARPVPVCLVARELISSRLVRLWQDQLGPEPPFDIDDETLFVAFFASAEIECFLALGWPVPTRILDLYAEFRVETNGLTLGSRGLLGALSYHNIPSITSEEKHEERALVMRGGPWTPAERERILDYCQTDVDVLAPLIERMLPRIRMRRPGLAQALLRGRYSAAVARMQWTGVPIDVETLGRIREHWLDIKQDLIAAVDKDYDVFEGTTFKAGKFAAYLHAEGIEWPRTEVGNLALDKDTFRDMARRYPQLEPLRELRVSLAELRLEKLAVGPDGRNRVLLSQFGARSGRNTPSNTQFVFGPSTWIRGLIKPPEGRAVAYIDWSSQEVWIAAALSGDRALLDSVLTGDPYLAFAKRSGLAPAHATKETHKAVRDMCKVAVLATNYGMGARKLALSLGLSLAEAEDVLRRLNRTFPTYMEWAEHQIDIGMVSGYLHTVFGWSIRVTSTSRPTMLRNFPMQSNGAEMLRIAACEATEAGIDVCAPVHDALLVEGPAVEIEDVVSRTRQAMDVASRAVLDGLTIPTDADVVRYPDRYMDPRGAVMWDRVNELI